MTVRAFVGLGEGIGNVVMGLPLLDALHARGDEVHVNLLPTPPQIEEDLLRVIARGRPWLFVCEPRDVGAPFDVAFLTHWWVSRCGGVLPPAHEVRVGGAPSADVPEILANLDVLSLDGPLPSPRAVLHAEPLTARTERVHVGVHPGCKPSAEWRALKVYPRWAEVVHRIKDCGGEVTVIGTQDDDAYCGEPHHDLRGTTTLPEVVEAIAALDVLVSGDSGLHHVAVALGVPTVALFGGTSVVKASHPAAVVAPVVMASPEWSIDPREVARVAVDAGSRRRAAA